jgi:hypothetical protein
MQSALHITANVLPGNRIEIQLPCLAEGEEVDVFIVLPGATSSPDSPNSADRLAQLAEMAEDADCQILSSGRAYQRLSRQSLNHYFLHNSKTSGSIVAFIPTSWT